MREFDTVKTRYQQLPIDLELLAERQVTDLPGHTVTITDISDIDLAGHEGTRLGQNKVYMYTILMKGYWLGYQCQPGCTFNMFKKTNMELSVTREYIVYIIFLLLFYFPFA